MLNSSEYFRYARMLESFHSIFYKIWDMGKPVFTEQIPTAAVTFDKNGGFIQFLFNPKFWESLDDYSRLFVICHESLHVLLDHGPRTVNIKNKQKLNVALDVVVNHSLINEFGFIRSLIKNEKDLCWIDTVFKNDKSILEDMSFEYYYNKLPDAPNQQSMDSHEYLEGIPDDILKQIGKFLDDEEKESLKKIVDNDKTVDEKTQEKRAGTDPGGNWLVVQPPRIIKRKWETIIKKWYSKAYNFVEEEQWARRNRRFVELPQDMFLPSTNEVEDMERNKLDVWLFQDTSGSCKHLAERFFKAAKSIPQDRFNVRVFCFDTKVYETDLKSGKLYGFGGTSFSCIEQYIQSHCNGNYPYSVFVVTDGMGDSVVPQEPSRWHWFLSEDYRYCIPKESKVFMLSDME